MGDAFFLIGSLSENFLSDPRQPKVNFLHLFILLADVVAQIVRSNRPFKRKDLTTQIWWCQGISPGKNPYFRLTCMRRSKTNAFA